MVLRISLDLLNTLFSLRNPSTEALVAETYFDVNLRNSWEGVVLSTSVDKHGLSERDICTKFITPALRKAGWDEILQIREEVGFTKGRIIVRGKLVTRGQAKRADYVLYYKPNIPLALIEAKDNSHSVGDGMQQALDYASTLEIPFVFSSNGDGFVFHDRTGASSPREANLGLDSFPSPADLWARYRAWKGLDAQAEQVVLQDYYVDGSETGWKLDSLPATTPAAGCSKRSLPRRLRRTGARFGGSGMKERRFGEWTFWLIGTIEPERNSAGDYLEFMPQSRFRNAATAKLHAYGSVRSASFGLPADVAMPGCTWSRKTKLRFTPGNAQILRPDGVRTDTEEYPRETASREVNQRIAASMLLSSAQRGQVAKLSSGLFRFRSILMSAERPKLGCFKLSKQAGIAQSCHDRVAESIGVVRLARGEPRRRRRSSRSVARSAARRGGCAVQSAQTAGGRMTLWIDYQSQHFPGAYTLRTGTLNTSWDELLWAAITVGRPSTYHVFRHGPASFHEAIFRLSLIRLSVQQDWYERLQRTDTFASLDPTEKGMVSYFLGMTICKLFASRLLATPWLLHLDVFRPWLNPVTLGRSRPDLVGEDNTGKWLAFESKGRSSVPSEKDKVNAKAQANRLWRSTVRRVRCTSARSHFFGRTCLSFIGVILVPMRGSQSSCRNRTWSGDIITSLRSTLASMPEDAILASDREKADISVTIHPKIHRLLDDGRWSAARETAKELEADLKSHGYQPDGLRVAAGPSWLRPLEMVEK